MIFGFLNSIETMRFQKFSPPCVIVSGMDGNSVVEWSVVVACCSLCALGEEQVLI